MARVSEDEVLLLWRALMAYRSASRPACQATGRPARSPCPLYDQCPRWTGPDDCAVKSGQVMKLAFNRRRG